MSNQINDVLQRITAAIDKREVLSRELQGYFIAGDRKMTNKVAAKQASIDRKISKLNKELEALKA